MPDGVPFRIGQQTRTLRFDFIAVEAAERHLGGEDLQTVVFSKLSTLNLWKVAAAGLSTPEHRVVPPQVRGWMAAEPTQLPALERAVQMAVALHLREVGKMSDEDLRLLGEAHAIAARASGGTPSSSAAGA